MEYLKLSCRVSHGCNYLSPRACRRHISSSRLKECHDLLKVDRTATPKQIKENFLRLSKIYHPDNKVTGSHTKFVQLKQAYDEIKDAPTTSSRNFYDHEGSEHMSHKAYAQYRERHRSYYHEDDYASRYAKQSHGFGGPYANSENPWEKLRRDRVFRRRQVFHQNPARLNMARNVSKLIIVLCSVYFMLAVKDFGDEMSKGILDDRVKHRDEYLKYRKYLKEREKTEEKAN